MPATIEVGGDAATGGDTFSDNAWIKNEIDTDPNLLGTLQAGDVNRDGSVDGDDVTAFVAGWLKEKRFDGVHNSMTAGDWETWGWGDMNHDGAVNFHVLLWGIPLSGRV